MESMKPAGQEDPIGHAWRVLGILLSLAAFLAFSLPPLLRGEDPAPASARAAAAFLSLWALNRVLASAFGLDRPPVECPDTSEEEGTDPGQ
jgi:predicted cobalt transporter CbtA